MKKKRDQLEILHDILAFISEKKGGAKPTHILYKSNLSHQMLVDYLNDLRTKELIKETVDKEGKKLYEITPKGYGFLKDYSLIKNFMESYGFE